MEHLGQTRLISGHTYVCVYGRGNLHSESHASTPDSSYFDTITSNILYLHPDSTHLLHSYSPGPYQVSDLLGFPVHHIPPRLSLFQPKRVPLFLPLHQSLDLSLGRSPILCHGIVTVTAGSP